MNWFFTFLIFAAVNISIGQNNGLITDQTIDLTKDPELWSLISKNDTLLQEYEYVKDLHFSTFTYQSDSFIVNGFRIEPKQKGKYPVIIFNRGGNRDFGKLNMKMLFFSTAVLAKEGYVILASNYREKDEFGGKDINDVLNLIPIVDQLPNVDTSKIGMFGWSRGGIMTYLALKETSRIKTAVIGNSPSNLFHSIAFRPELEENPLSQCIPNYWSNKEIEFKKRSAIYWADSLCKKSSILLLAGTLDAQVDYNESVSMAERLKEINYDYELKLVETNHGFSGKRDELNNELTSWFNSRLKSITTDQKKKISITIDDVPNTRKFQADNYHSNLLAVLDSINIPVAIFVNEGLLVKTDSVSRNGELLENWIKKRYVTVGNHTFSHSRYSDVGFHQFKQDIEKGEKHIKAIAAKYGKSVDYFRFPYNDLGIDSLQQLKMDSLLKALNYQNTPFTIESSDWMFNSLYECYLTNGELEKAAEIGKLYVSKTLDFVRFSDSITHVNYNRNINQIYLCHDNSINAHYLKDIISTLKKEGYEFVTLEHALEDPVYSQKNYYYKKWGISWLYRWMSDVALRMELMTLEPDINHVEQHFQQLIKNK